MKFDWSSLNPSDGENGHKWADAADLSRLSRESLIGHMSPVRRNRSTGWLRLLGEGVAGHAASVEAVAASMSAFQKLVLSVGMSLEGHRYLRGAAPKSIVQRSALMIESSPTPGSLILNFVPSFSVGKEILPDGQADFLRTDEKMLVDNAVESAIGLLSSSKFEGITNVNFNHQLEDVGPRVTTALRNFARTLSNAGFEADLAWEVPRQPRVQTKMTTANLSRLVELVSATQKDTERVSINGTVRTVSDVEFLRVDADDGTKLSLNARKIPVELIKSFRVGDRVAVEVDVQESSGSGLEATLTYKLISIRAK